MKDLKVFLAEEDGIAVVEIVLILLVLIALVVIFKKQINSILSNLLKKAESETKNF